MKVMPNSAMITVTTADSKYSRQTVFGGPCGFTGGSGCLSWPLRLKNRDTVEGFCSAVSGLLVEILLVVRLVAIQKHPRYVTGGGQVYLPDFRLRDCCRFANRLKTSFLRVRLSPPPPQLP